MKIEVLYKVDFGKSGGVSNEKEWSTELTEGEERRYMEYFRIRKPFDEYMGLDEVLERAYKEIERFETKMAYDRSDPFVYECLGRNRVSPSEVNDLVHSGDEYARSFFNLCNLSDAECEEWDANNAGKMPRAEDFYRDFRPESPFDSEWALTVRFKTAEEDENFSNISEDEAAETLRWLISSGEDPDEFVFNVEDYCNYDFDLDELVMKIDEEI